MPIGNDTISSIDRSRNYFSGGINKKISGGSKNYVSDKRHDTPPTEDDNDGHPDPNVQSVHHNQAGHRSNSTEHVNINPNNGTTSNNREMFAERNSYISGCRGNIDRQTRRLSHNSARRLMSNSDTDADQSSVDGEGTSVVDYHHAGSVAGSDRIHRQHDVDAPVTLAFRRLHRNNTENQEQQ